MTTTTTTLDDLFDVLAIATGHLRRHCKCSGSSRCVPCEVAVEAHDALEQLREWRAQAAALVKPLAHVARCAEAITSNYPDCSLCAQVERGAQDAQASARSWEERRRG